jgi:hypothetical protein
MRWNERFQIALPELLRLDGRTIGGGFLLTPLIQAGAHYPTLEGYLLCALSGLVASKALFWGSDLLNTRRLAELEVGRGQKTYRQSLSRIKKLRKEACPALGILKRNKSFLNEEDRRILQRIEEIVEEIERQFSVADLYLQRNLLPALPQIVQQAICAMENARKLSLLLEFVEKEDLRRLESEESRFREQAQQTPSGALGTLHSQAHRFKAQQIANVLNAQKDIAIYRAQLYALEAGLANVRGRIASMSSIERADVGLELEALNAEISTMDEGLRMAARATAGEYYHAGGRIRTDASASSSASTPPFTASTGER